MKRPDGRVDVYWVASPEAVRAGYAPKTVPLRDDPGDETPSAEIAARCRAYWAEMLEFLAGVPRGPAGAAVGTLAWLCDLYQSDPDSPYRRIRSSTRPGYDRSVAIVRESVGERRIDGVTANDVRRWFRKWGRAGDDGVLENPRRAYGCVQLLRIVVKFGKGQRLAGCRDLSEILTDAEFPVPRGRTVAMTPEQAAAIIEAAKAAGFPSIARAVAIQFCCALRQKDVIGEWVDGRWSGGLLWGEHITSDWSLAKPTSKSNFREVAEFNLLLLPPALAELQAVPLTRRIGPVIIDEASGLPYQQRRFARRFRGIARAAGVPDDVWNMDSRAGAVTDAYDKGASLRDAMDLGTHTQVSTSLRYSRKRLASTNRVAELRFGAGRETPKKSS